MKRSSFLLLCLPLVGAEFCCSVKDLKSALVPSLTGRYFLLGHSSVLRTINSRCKTGCVYAREGDASGTQYCFEASSGATSTCSSGGCAPSSNNLAEPGQPSEGCVTKPVEGEVVTSKEPGPATAATAAVCTDPNGLYPHPDDCQK